MGFHIPPIEYVSDKGSLEEFSKARKRVLVIRKNFVNKAELMLGKTIEIGLYSWQEGKAANRSGVYGFLKAIPWVDNNQLTWTFSSWLMVMKPDQERIEYRGTVEDDFEKFLKETLDKLQEYESIYECYKIFNLTPPASQEVV